MAQLCFRVSTLNQDRLDNMLAVAKINAVKQLAELKSWEFDGPEYNHGINEYWVAIPDDDARRALQDMQERGFIPDVVRFTDETAPDRADAITTLHCDHNWDLNPED